MPFNKSYNFKRIKTERFGNFPVQGTCANPIDQYQWSVNQMLFFIFI